MKKQFKKLLVIVLLFNSGFSLKYVHETFFKGDNVKKVIKPFYKNQNYIEDIIYSDLNKNYNEDSALLKINNIRTLSDLNNNNYNLVEFLPSGYAIYNQDYSLMLEMSSTANSPYLNQEGELIYLGAFNYYTVKKDALFSNGEQKLVHCVENYEIELNEKNTQVLNDYARSLKGNIEKELTQKSISAYGISTYYDYTETTSVKQASILKNANTTKFNTNNCGYVAAALIIFYAAKAWGWNYLYEKENIDVSLVNEIQGNRGNSSTAPDIENALNEYMNKKDAQHPAKVNMWHIPADHTFYDRVSEDKPVILFGRLTSVISNGGEIVYLPEKIEHAVVVYEVTREVTNAIFGIKFYSNYRYKVHYGWTQEFNDVTISHSAIAVGGLVNLHK